MLGLEHTSTDWRNFFWMQNGRNNEIAMVDAHLKWAFLDEKRTNIDENWQIVATAMSKSRLYTTYITIRVNPIINSYLDFTLLTLTICLVQNAAQRFCVHEQEKILVWNVSCTGV